DPQEEKVRTRRGLYVRGIGLAARSKRAEEESAGGDGEQDDAREEDIPPNRIGHKRLAIAMDQFLILPQIRRPPDHSTWHGPLADSQFQHKKHMQADERDQQSRNDENMQCKEARQCWTRDYGTT